MKLTDLWTGAECREVLKLLGEVEWERPGLGPWDYKLGQLPRVPQACILQVAAEQTVNAANVRYYCAHGEMTNTPPYAVERAEAEEGNAPGGIATLTADGEWVRYGKPALFQTKLEALLGVLRAMKETRT